ncbi:hypothetical protein ACFSJS_08885 [Streptomyces desertarenae]|uniref:Uncharacterized protein n=1 Tax=Streptomyces desertarenae TaxID=2666184 RepID=A0ABW4PHM7_9ACTN
MTMVVSRRLAARHQPVPVWESVKRPGLPSTSRFSRARAPSPREATALSQPSATAAAR